MRKLIFGGTIVNEGRCFRGSIIIDDDRITEISEDSNTPHGTFDETIDATGCFVLPGVIDEHVHFREPGLTDKASIETESRAAAWGGVTTYFDMPNTSPQTTTLEALGDKFQRAEKESHVNYSFFFGATNTNVALFRELDRTSVPGIKLFMGASTGNMLVDKLGSLLDIFRSCSELDLPLMVHCEDTDIINENMRKMQKAYGEDPMIMLHPLIRSEEACYDSSAMAANLAHQYGTRLHIAHISTARELDLLNNSVTGEACIAHLLFSSDDYAGKGALIKCNPAVKRPEDRDALRAALADGRIATVATDHAPHLMSQKQGGCKKAASGMPMLQFSLPTMLELADEGVITIERVVELMSHRPARLFSVAERGFIRKGYKADITIVRPDSPWQVTEDIIQSKCKWSPVQGHEYKWRVEQTLCNGQLIYDRGHFDDRIRGEAVRFRL
jgi:dihydroorotase